MPETVKLFGKPVNKNVVLVGGAIAVGVVGYAWFKNAQQPTTLPPGSLPEPVPEPTDTPGFEVLGTAPAPMTNAEWTTQAVEKMTNIGYDSLAIGNALGKFLARQRLNKTEVQLVQTALGLMGQPPVGGPWNILEEETGGVAPVTVPGRVTGLRAVGPSSGTHFLIVWDPVPGATGYIVKGYSHGSQVWGPDWPETQARHEAYLGPGHYSYYVAATNSAGWGPFSSAVEFDKQ